MQHTLLPPPPQKKEKERKKKRLISSQIEQFSHSFVWNFHYATFEKSVKIQGDEKCKMKRHLALEIFEGLARELSINRWTGRECWAGRGKRSRGRWKTPRYLEADVRLTRLFSAERRTEWYFAWWKKSGSFETNDSSRRLRLRCYIVLFSAQPFTGHVYCTFRRFSGSLRYTLLFTEQSPSSRRSVGHNDPSWIYEFERRLWKTLRRRYTRLIIY